MSVALVTGAGGLVGSAACEHFAGMGMDIVGIDNDMRRVFFGDHASTAWNVERLERRLGVAFQHVDVDIRDREAIRAAVAEYGRDLAVVVHAAAQPSHDWAARDPATDFEINALATLHLLEAVRDHAPHVPFAFCSTNKVYGDTPNALPLVELETRWEVDEGHEYAGGITESMSIDRSLHSLFGVSKAAADLLVQEYGRYFDLMTGCFRAGTITGPVHAATELHGFLAYVARCAMTGTPYVVHGYKGKQVRDAIHADDLVRAFAAFAAAPRCGEVYNIGGGRQSNASVVEAIALTEEIVGESLNWSYSDVARRGDHIWWIGSNERFRSHYPEWRQEHDVGSILREIVELNAGRWTR